MANLVPLFEEALEFQDYNGTVLSNGKAAVYYIGRTRLADIYNDVAAEYPAENPRILNNLGMGPVYVNPAFDYELVVFDEYNNELFSVKKYLHSKGEHSTANVVVTPSENIAVSAWTVGDVQFYMPYLTGQLGKVYTGIEPIVVNNTEDKISANHVPLGVQDPLYFVQDDEEGCIIGISGGTVPEGTMNESGLGFVNNKITGYNGSAFSAGNEYEAGSYVDITDNTISVTGLQPAGDYAYNSALSSKLDVTALPQDLVHSGDLTAYQPVGDYQTAGDYLSASDSGKFYPMEGNPSGFLTAHQSLAGYATEQWVENKGYITGVDIPESANWNSTYNTVHDNSGNWTGGGTANPRIPVTGINGIKISESGDQVVFEVSGIFNSVFANTVFYSDKPTADPIQASQNDLVNVGRIIGSSNSNFYIVPSSVLQVPNIITAVNVGLTANGLSAHTANGLSANGLTADVKYMSGFSAIGISAGKRGPLCIEGQYEIIDAKGNSGFTFSSHNTAFGTAALTTAQGNNLVKMPAPKFEVRNISGAGFSIEASGAKGYDESGNVVWDTYTPQVKNIISYSDTKTAAGGLNGNIILTVMPSTNASNLTSAPYVIMDANQASYFAAYGPSAQTPTVSMVPSQIKFELQAGNTGRTTVGYNDVKQELSGSAWTLTGSIQKRELEYDADTSAITAIAGSAIGGGGGGGAVPESVSAATDYVTANSANIDATVSNVSANSGAWGGSALPISAGKGIKFELINDTLVASVTSTYTSGYVWQSASLFHTDTPVKQTTYTLSDNCSNYDRLDVDFYDVDNWRTVMQCPIPSNLDASGTRGGYFSVVPASTATDANIWFKAFNWTAAGTTWSCYCSELAGQGGSTTQTINANQPDNPPKVMNIIGWKRVGGN